MANPARGEVALKAGDKTYTLDLSMNALCEIEEEAGRSITSIAAELNDPQRVSMKIIRMMLWGALREHHKKLDLAAAGRIGTEAGIPAVVEALGKALNASAPEGDTKADPRQATAA